MDDTTVLGQLGQIAKKIGQQVTKAPVGIIEDVGEQVGLNKPSEEGKQNLPAGGWKSREDREEFLRGLYGTSPSQSETEQIKAQEKAELTAQEKAKLDEIKKLHETSANPLIKAEEKEDNTSPNPFVKAEEKKENSTSANPFVKSEDKNQTTSANPFVKAEEKQEQSEFEEKLKDLSPEERKKIIALRKKLHEEGYFEQLNNPPKQPEERPAEKVENEKKKEMVELQEKEQKKPQPLPVAVMRERNKAEMFRGAAG
jgi:hypothetical protein